MDEKKEKDFLFLCPVCTCGNSPERTTCALCGANLRTEEEDYQLLRLEDITDGYHSWYSQPTAYHRIYRCANYPRVCGKCVHRKGGFCVGGRVDIRDPVKKGNDPE